MRTRPALAAIAALALIAAPAAANAKAKPKPPAKKYCNLLVDDGKNDGKSKVYPMVSSSSLDVTGGDFATGPKTMVAVLKLAGTDFSLATDHWAATLGYTWNFATTTNTGQKYTFTAKIPPYGLGNSSITSSLSINGASAALKSFKVDLNAHTFTWVVDRSVDKTLTRKNTVFKQFRADDNSGGVSADDAPDQNPTSASYPDKASSCVRAG